MSYEKGRLCSINLLLFQSPPNKKATFRTICQCQETPLHTKGYQKGKKRGLNKKVSSAVFRAWTDKQKKFYVCAKCNLTQQTSSVHWNIPPPCSAESSQNIDPHM